VGSTIPARSCSGCNVGILAYEISKRGPTFIHALDGSREMLGAAKPIFRSVDTPHQLDLVDLANDCRLRELLRPSYDIVQLLAVYQHVERARGDRAARRMLATLTEHSTETFVAASNPATRRRPAISAPITARTSSGWSRSSGNTIRPISSASPSRSRSRCRRLA